MDEHFSQEECITKHETKCILWGFWILPRASGTTPFYAVTPDHRFEKNKTHSHFHFSLWYSMTSMEFLCKQHSLRQRIIY